MSDRYEYCFICLMAQRSLQIFPSFLQCTVPTGQGANIPLLITTTVGALTNAEPYYWRYARPNITYFEPQTAETVGAVRLRINGTSMGTTGTVTVGGKQCPLIGAGWSHTYIECLLPAGQVGY